MTNIYILKLEENRYYVGKSKDIDNRYEQHISNDGSSWTQKFKPIEIIKVINNCDSFEEDKQVKQLMSIYGIDNVRGGSYTKINLTEEEKKLLQKEIWGANDCCIRCGRKNHFVKDCYANIDINNNKIYDLIDVWCCENCDKEFRNKDECEQHELKCKKNKKNKNVCYRCGRYNHYQNNCYASTHIDGYDLDSNTDDWILIGK